ncbi:MAG: hypothetical protein V4539_17080 [Bacteroidota bacterium]
MKRIILLVSGLLLLGACHKNAYPVAGDGEIVQRILQRELSAADMNVADISTLQSATLRSGHHIYRLRMGKENIVLETDGTNQFLKGAIYTITGSIAKNNGHTTYSGVFDRSDLSRKNAVHWSIDKGFAKELHSFTTVATNGTGQQHVNYECADCTLPEVTVSASYPKSGGIDWFTWMSLLSMFDMGSQNDYIAVDWVFGGGGGSSPSAPVITIDQENAENKDKIEPKKYTDCFGSIPDGSTTLYTVTISTDLPTDGHPEIFYNWSDGSPGHAFIELNKSTPYGGVSQDFGFYPTSSYKLITLDNINLASKVVDDGGHEYQARYTISVSAAQFQAAVNAVNSARDTYNVGNYNCTDFALGVFNAAGGGLTIPRHSIPGFEVDGGSNTPQGLYEKIQSLKNNGAANTSTTNNKEYAGSSKGPCD